MLIGSFYTLPTTFSIQGAREIWVNITPLALC
jgi:hypothetical protein